MVPPMAVSAGGKSLAKQRTGKVRSSWFSPVVLLTLAAVTSSSLSALSLYQLMALRAEVEGLRSEVGRRREEGEFKIKCESQVRGTVLVFKCFIHHITLINTDCFVFV